MRLLRRCSLSHEVYAFLKHAGVSHAVVDEFTEPLRDDSTSVGVVGHFFDSLT